MPPAKPGNGVHQRRNVDERVISTERRDLKQAYQIPHSVRHDKTNEQDISSLRQGKEGNGSGERVQTHDFQRLRRTKAEPDRRAFTLWETIRKLVAGAELKPTAVSGCAEQESSPIVGQLG